MKSPVKKIAYLTILAILTTSAALLTPKSHAIPEEPPPTGDEGCTPGYWKNHISAWPAGVSPSDNFDDTFGVDFFDPDVSLLDALRTGGGKEKRVARHGVAALLNSLQNNVEYPYTAGAVIGLVQNQKGDDLEDANELGCPLNHSGVRNEDGGGLGQENNRGRGRNK